MYVIYISIFFLFQKTNSFSQWFFSFFFSPGFLSFGVCSFFYYHNTFIGWFHLFLNLGFIIYTYTLTLCAEKINVFCWVLNGFKHSQTSFRLELNVFALLLIRQYLSFINYLNFFSSYTKNHKNYHLIYNTQLEVMVLCLFKCEP